MTETINVEVAYALADEQLVLTVNIDTGTTAVAAIEQSGLLQKFPDIEINKIGIFGKIIKNDTILKEGDRVEVYRPLIADPKEVRRQRAKEGKEMKRGGS